MFGKKQSDAPSKKKAKTVSIAEEAEKLDAAADAAEKVAEKPKETVVEEKPPAPKKEEPVKAAPEPVADDNPAAMLAGLDDALAQDEAKPEPVAEKPKPKKKTPAKKAKESAAATVDEDDPFAEEFEEEAEFVLVER